MTTMPRNKVKSCGNDDIMFRLKYRNTSSSIVLAITMNYILTFYEELKEVMRSHAHGIVWMEKGVENVESFVGFPVIL